MFLGSRSVSKNSSHVADAQLVQVSNYSMDRVGKNALTLASRSTGSPWPQPQRRRAYAPALGGRTQFHVLVAVYSITSSARVRSVGGKSKPSVLAVLRLITNSNLVG